MVDDENSEKMNDSFQPRPDPGFEKTQKDSASMSFPPWIRIATAILAVIAIGVGIWRWQLKDSDTGLSSDPELFDEMKTADRGSPMTGSFVTFEGEKKSLAQTQGKVVIVTFWASWCSPCLIELPTFKTLIDRFPKEDLEIVAINLDDDETLARNFMKESWNPEKLPFAAYLDPTREMMKTFKVETIPSTFVLDRKGRIAMSAVGSQDWSDDALIENIGDLILEHPTQ